jgi:hypothetical protein
MLRTLHVRTLVILLLCMGSINIQAQTTEELRISSIQLDTLASELVVEVRFSSRLDKNHSEDLNSSNVTVTTLPSNTNLNVRSVSRVTETPRRLQIFFTSPTLPAASAGDNQIRVCFTALHFISADGTPATTTSQVCEMGMILTRTNRTAEMDKQLKVLQETEKTSEEKNIFASGFVVNGEGGDAEGGADINLNSNDLGVRGLTAFARLKKATAEEADPKSFEIGINQRSTSLIGRGSLSLIRQYRAIMLDPTKSEAEKDAAEQGYKELLQKRQRRILGGVFFDLGVKIEAQALSFDVTNIVGDGMLQLQSRTKRLFGSKNGFVRFRLIPAGMEFGYNLSDNATAQTNAEGAAQNTDNTDWIARFKFGGVLTLFYKNNSESAGFIKRVELDVQAVNRYLFRREVAFDETTMMNTSTDRGNKPWFQANLKIFFTDPEEGTPGMRTGFKLSYNRGSLPPVFADTKSFQFGFIMESTENKK